MRHCDRGGRYRSHGRRGVVHRGALARGRRGLACDTRQPRSIAGAAATSLGGRGTHDADVRDRVDRHGAQKRRGGGRRRTKDYISEERAARLSCECTPRLTRSIVNSEIRRRKTMSREAVRSSMKRDGMPTEITRREREHTSGGAAHLGDVSRPSGAPTEVEACICAPSILAEPPSESLSGTLRSAPLGMELSARGL